MAFLHDEAQRRKDEEAVASGHCPETGIDLADKDVRNHIAMLFPRWQEPGMETTDYGRRARLLNAYADMLDEKKAAEAKH